MSRHQASEWIWFPGRASSKSKDESIMMAKGSAVNALAHECSNIPIGIKFNEECMETSEGLYKTYVRASIKQKYCKPNASKNMELSDLRKNYLAKLKNKSIFQCTKSNITDCLDKTKEYFFNSKINESKILANTVCIINTSSCKILSRFYYDKNMIRTSVALLEKDCKIHRDKSSCNQHLYDSAMFLMENSSAHILYKNCFDKKNPLSSHCHALYTIQNRSGLSIDDRLNTLNAGCEAEKRFYEKDRKNCETVGYLSELAKLAHDCTDLKSNDCSKKELVTLFYFAKELKTSDLHKIAQMACNKYDTPEACLYLAGYFSETDGKTSARSKNTYKRYLHLIDNKCSSPEDCSNMGWYQYKSGETKKALKMYNKLYSKMVDDSYFLNNYAVMLYTERNTSKAFELWHRSCNLENKYGCYNLSAKYASLKNDKLAISYLKSALENGYDHWAWLNTNIDSKNLRMHPDFKKTIETFQ